LNSILEKSGLLTLIRPTEKRTSTQKVLWECRCDCTKTCYIPLYKFKSGRQRSCGCARFKRRNSAVLEGEHKISLELVKEILSKKGYVYLFGIVENLESLVNASCSSCGRESAIRISKETKCHNCVYVKEQKKLFQKILSRAVELNFKILMTEEEFLKACEPIGRSEQARFLVKCNRNHIYEICYSNFKRYGCGICSGKGSSNQ